MDFLETYGSIIDDLRKELKEISKESKKAADESDKRWHEKLDTKCVLKTSNKVYTAREAIKVAKKQRDYIIQELLKGSLDPKLTENLTYLNEVIAAYNSEFEDKENDKSEILYTDTKIKKGLAIKNAIVKSIEKIDEQVSYIMSNSKDFKDCEDKGELEIVKSNYEKIIDLKQFKKSLEKLLTYNGEIISKSKLNAITNNLTEDAKNVVEMYYTLITDSLINMNKLEGKKPNLNDDEKNLIDEVNYYLDIAKDNNSKAALNYACDLIKNIKDKDIQNDLEAEAAEIAIKICDDKELKEASRFVELAEKTQKAKDFYNAKNAVNNLNDGKEKEKLNKRIDSLEEQNKNIFSSLIDHLKQNITDEKLIKKGEIEELSDRYQYLPEAYLNQPISDDETIKDDYDRIVTIYNNQVQNEYQEDLDEEEFKKYSLQEKFVELFGSVVNFISGTKVVKNFNKKRLERLNKKLAEAETDEEKEKYENKIKKTNKSISDNDVVSGVKLFIARNKLAKKKFKLYKGNVKDSDFVTTEDNERVYENKATNNISKSLSKGLSRKLKDESIFEDRNRVITIFDQYLELIASGTYDKEYVDEFIEVLRKVAAKKAITENEFHGYLEELKIICNYRAYNEYIPYHLDTDEVDDVIKFYDSDEYKTAKTKPRYIKRK